MTTEMPALTVNYFSRNHAAPQYQQGFRAKPGGEPQAF
jgi:hypothetical protein